MLTTEQLRTPVWDSDTIWQESLMFLRSADGVAEAPLLFEPVEIIEVTDAAGKTLYEAGRDYILDGSVLRLTPDSRIFSFTQDTLYPAVGVEGHFFPYPEGNILFEEGRFFPDHQVAVSYTCRNTWQGVRPVSAEKELPRTFRMLRAGQPLNLVLNGDSISAGANATALLQIPPFQKDYGRMVYDMLCDTYPGPIRYVNTSVGGMDINWAVDNVQRNIIDYNPDLCIVAFGMNDGGKTPELFGRQVRTLITEVRKVHPECEFLLVATSTPNPILTDPRAKFWGNQALFKAVLDEIAADTSGVAVANITHMQKELMRRKRFIDLTSNHVNHPNDFFYRCYAHFIGGMLTLSANDAML